MNKIRPGRVDADFHNPKKLVTDQAKFIKVDKLVMPWKRRDETW